MCTDDERLEHGKREGDEIQELDCFPTLLSAIKDAHVGTGEVRQVIESASFKVCSRDITRLITSCKSLKQWEKAIEILDVTKQGHGTPTNVSRPNFFTYSAAISVCCKTGRLMEADQLLEEMKVAAGYDPSLSPDRVVYRMLVSCCAKADRAERVLGLYKEMERLGVDADEQTMQHVLTAQINVKELGAASVMIDRMHEGGKEISSKQYVHFIAACSEVGNLEMAIELFLIIQMQGVEPCQHICHYLMEAIEAACLPTMGVQLLQEMLEAGIPVHMGTFVSLVRAVSSSNMFELMQTITWLLTHHEGESWSHKKCIGGCHNR